MALFGKKETKNETTEASKKEVKALPVTPQVTTGRNLASVIKKPRVTEKAVRKTEENVYTFEVRQDATKHDVRDAVKEFFNVTPRKINIVTQNPRKRVARMRGRVISAPGLKKAYVYLKEGDRIDMV